MLILRGWLASSWFEIRTTVDRIALIPGISVVMMLLSGIAVLAVWRGPLTTAKGVGGRARRGRLGGAFRMGDAWLQRPLEAFGGFFNGLFAVFSNRDFAILMGVQFLVQAGQGIIQGAIGKSIAFGGKEGFDIQNVPSADYLLKVVLALYVPYTLLSPFIGVFIDRFARRRVVWWTNLITSGVVAVVAAVVLLPLGDGTTQGKTGSTDPADRGPARRPGGGPRDARREVGGHPRRALGQGPAPGQRTVAGGRRSLPAGRHRVRARRGRGSLPGWIIVIVGAAVLVIAAIVARQMQHVERAPHDTTFGREASQVVHNVDRGHQGDRLQATGGAWACCRSRCCATSSGASACSCSRCTPRIW